MIIELAKVKIKINNKYQYLTNQCINYVIDSEDYDFEVSVTDEEIKEEMSSSQLSFKEGYHESLAIYRKISFKLLEYDAFLMHGATIKIEDAAYAFLARSGTGKTTHTRLLKEYLGDKMSYINGDKPIIRIIDNVPYAFGTPWNGKEMYGENTYAPLKSLVFIERAPYNSIELLDKKTVFNRLVHQILLPDNEEQMNKTLDLVNVLINETKQYLLKCNMDIEAAKVSYNTFSK